MMKSQRRIAIIGCGYIGAALGERLAADGNDVVGTTTTEARIEALRSLGISPVVLDVADGDRLHEMLADRDAAILTIAPKSRGQDYRDVYLAAVNSLTRAAVGTAVRRIIYTSSTRVYGQTDGCWVDEDSPMEPADDKGRVLLEAERVLLARANDTADAASLRSDDPSPAVTVLRLSGIYGPGRDASERIASLAGTERDDSNVYVNRIHRDDVVLAMVALLDVHHHGALNLSSQQPQTRREFYDAILKAKGLPPIRWLSGGVDTSRGKRIRSARIRELLHLPVPNL